MKVHEEELWDVARYLEDQGDFALEDMEDSSRNYLRLITQYHPGDASTRKL